MEILITKEELGKLIFERDLLDAKIEAYSKMLKHGHSEWLSDSNDNQEVRFLQVNIERYKSEKQRIDRILNNMTIIRDKDKNIEDYVALDDVLQIELIDEEGKHETSLIQLVGINVDLDGDIYKITIDSPIGRAIYGKTYGSTVNYEVNGVPYTLIIKQKINKNILENDDKNEDISRSTK